MEKYDNFDYVKHWSENGFSDDEMLSRDENH